MSKYIHMKLNWIISAAMMLWFNAAYAQVGRHELPRDTTAIGGQEQEIKMNRMEAKPLLLENLSALRDSVQTALEYVQASPGDQNEARAKQAREDLKRSKSQLEKTINDVQSKRWNENMSERAYETLNQVRREFKRLQKEGVVQGG
jgi:hypothetical protein